MALVFVGGAAGKLVCGLLAERFGLIRTVVITEAATALGIAIIVVVPLSVAVAAMVPMGIALNGTSSALYGTVAEFVIPERRSRGYGLYYTIAISASALAPFIYGVFGDLVGVPRTLALIAGAALITIPLALTLRPAVAAPARAA